MAKRSLGGIKLKQKGFVKPKTAKNPAKKHHKKGPVAPWADSTKFIGRGGYRH